MEMLGTIALKEWGIACDALSSGEQMILPKNGGIADFEGLFRDTKSRFLMMPTQFHADSSKLSAMGQRFHSEKKNVQESQNSIRLSLWGKVTETLAIESEDTLPRLVEHQVLSLESLRTRFRYRNPGIYVLIVRMFHVKQFQSVEMTPEMEGCKSWVPLPEPVELDEELPVISQTEFDLRSREVKNLLGT